MPRGASSGSCPRRTRGPRSAGRSSWRTRRPPGTRSRSRSTSPRRPWPCRRRCGTPASPIARSSRSRPRRVTVEGVNAGPERFDDGSFMGTPVYLGEIRTDEEGRLVVLGGHGVSRSSDGSIAITFANNEGWHDDVSDGPVTAEVTLGDRTLEVVPAWVVVAPPNYGPRRKSVRTMWDLMRDVAIKAGTLAAPVRPSYTSDILPLFRRLAGLQWVNAGFASGFGWKGLDRLHATSRFLARLGDNGPAERELRRVVANAVPPFRRRLLVAGAVALALRRCHEHPGRQDAAPVHGPDRHAARDAQAMGGGRLRGRLRPRASAVRDDRRGAPGRTGRDADPGGARVLPRRRLPSGLRDDVARAAVDDVHGAVPLGPPGAGLDRAGTGRGPHSGRRHDPQRPALRPAPGRHHPLDGRALADRHGELPLGI